MIERPILMNAPMVLATLAGRKTQTRRVVKPQPPEDHAPLIVEEIFPTKVDRHGDEYPGPRSYGVTAEDGAWCLPCPYGQPGDRLWVRETCVISPPRFDGLRSTSYNVTDPNGEGRICQYLASTPDTDAAKDYGLKVTPSIHMPRWASRILLEITEVRVQRLQEITEADARAEGIVDGGCTSCGQSEPCGCDNPQPDARDAFIHLWRSIYGPDSWAANPWVWAVNYKRTP